MSLLNTANISALVLAYGESVELLAKEILVIGGERNPSTLSEEYGLLYDILLAHTDFDFSETKELTSDEADVLIDGLVAELTT